MTSLPRHTQSGNTERSQSVTEANSFVASEMGGESLSEKGSLKLSTFHKHHASYNSS